jgi:hypothetical protein
MGERWCTVTLIEESGRRHSLDDWLAAPSTRHIFSSRGWERPATVDSQKREERKGPRGVLFSRRPMLDDFRR